ncbi:MAG: hypothetical protein NTZ48_04485 [Candidatus Omnitrophica bacterium]|nr:hypothetical protein [Candidatus Omnitrophota bacterium]
MGKFLAIVGGLVSILLGVKGLIVWFKDFQVLLKGGVPTMLIFGGLIALIAGIGEVKDSIARSKEKKQEKKEGEQK